MSSDRFLFATHQIIHAGAGTGKTHTLVTQYLHLLCGLTAYGRPLHPKEIVAITFTEKAGQELSDRIRSRIQQVLSSNEEEMLRQEPELIETANRLGRALPNATDWQDLLYKLDQAAIGTFHSFGSNILRKYAWMVGLPRNFKLLTAAETQDAWQQSAWSMLRTGLSEKNGYLSDLARIYGPTGSASGWGLTEGVIDLCKRRREDGLSFADLSIGYGDAFLTELWAHNAALFWRTLQSLFSEKMQWGPGSRTALEEHASLFDNWDSIFSTKIPTSDPLPALSAIEALLSRLRSSGQHQAALAVFKKELRMLIQRLKAIFQSIHSAPLAHAFASCCEATMQHYQEQKRLMGAVDFTDLIAYPLELIRKNPEIRASLRTQIKAMLVDEFQDTNAMQTELISWLIWDHPVPTKRESEPMSTSPRLYLVGDWKQSIYQFRGADVENFARMTQDIVHIGGTEQALQRSFRSVDRLIAFSNAFFSSAFGSTVAELDQTSPSLLQWKNTRDDLQPAQKATTAEPCVELLVAQHPSDPTWSATKRESVLISKRIHSLVTQGHPYKNMVLLLRRFTHLSTYVATFQEHGIPIEVIHGQGFYTSDEIRDALWLLAFLMDPTNRFALFAVLRSPCCSISDASLLELAMEKKPILAFPVCLPATWVDALPSNEKGAVQALLHFVRETHPHVHTLGPAACLQLMLKSFPLTLFFSQLAHSSQRLTNLHKLIDLAYLHEWEGKDMASFVAAMHERMQQEAAGELHEEPAFTKSHADQSVRLLTIHQSKGLEFPIVFIGGCANRERHDTQPFRYDSHLGVGLMIPSPASERAHTWSSLVASEKQRIKTHEEFIRLLYVAVTRAQHRVIFAGEGLPHAGTWLHLLEEFSQKDNQQLINRVNI